MLKETTYWSTNSTQQDRIGTLSSRQGLIRQRRTMRIDRTPSKQMFLEVELDIRHDIFDGAEEFDCLAHDLWTAVVTTKGYDVECGHDCGLF